MQQVRRSQKVISVQNNIRDDTIMETFAIYIVWVFHKCIKGYIQLKILVVLATKARPPLPPLRP